VTGQHRGEPPRYMQRPTEKLAAEIRFFCWLIVVLGCIAAVAWMLSLT
jgi:hypothetical protein